MDKNSVHAFPKDLDQQMAWSVAIGRQDFKPTKNSAVCSLHFEPSDYNSMSTDGNLEREIYYQNKLISLSTVKHMISPDRRLRSATRLNKLLAFMDSYWKKRQ